MWKVGQWYRFRPSGLPTFYYCEYVSDNGYGFLRVEKPERNGIDAKYCVGILNNIEYVPCEPPPWAELEYDPSQQKDEGDDV